jgi:hypothetical protein
MLEFNDISFFGNNYKIPQILERYGKVARIFCERRHVNSDIYDYSCLRGTDFHIIQGRHDLAGPLGDMPSGSVGVSYGFSIIFQAEDIARFEHGIWNIHPGHLPENRGRHPISWSFLKNDRMFGVTIHKIDCDIDRGVLLANVDIMRDLKDTQTEIEAKIVSRLDDGLFAEAVDAYRAGRGTILGSGAYHEALTGKFNVVDPRQYEPQFLFNLVKSQKIYGGVKIGGKQYLDCCFFNPACPDLYEGYEFFETKDGTVMALK